MNRTTIEWTTAIPGVQGFTWNPMHGCSKASPGCDNCYAERTATRLAGMGVPGYDKADPFKVTLHPDRLEQPFDVKKGELVFVCSMGDLFHEDVPYLFIDRVFNVMARNPQHFFLLLTKRAERMHHYVVKRAKMLRHFFGVRDEWMPTKTDPVTVEEYVTLPNVGLGVSVEDQDQEHRIIHLLKTPAALRFVSVEPCLGEIDFGGTGGYLDSNRWCDYGPDAPKKDYPALDWILCGGESGPGARPMHPEWVRSLRDQSKAAGTPFLFKQWGDGVQWIPGVRFTGNMPDN